MFWKPNNAYPLDARGKLRSSYLVQKGKNINYKGIIDTIT